MVGYCSTGRLKAAMAPASMITMAMTQAKTGRSMKKREIPMAYRLLLGRGGRYRHVGHDLLQSIDNHLVARFEAGQHLPAAVHGTAGGEDAQAGDILLIHNQG